MKSLMLLLSSILLFFVCTESMATEPKLRLCARYSVWLKSEQNALANYNQYFIREYLIDQSVPGHERMVFNLPLDLTAGTTIPVNLELLSQQGTHREFGGMAGNATCDGPWKSMTCNFIFRTLPYDAEKTAAYLTRRYGNTEKRDALVKIAASFGNDPIGVGAMTPREQGCH